MSTDWDGVRSTDWDGVRSTDWDGVRSTDWDGVRNTDQVHIIVDSTCPLPLSLPPVSTTSHVQFQVGFNEILRRVRTCPWFLPALKTSSVSNLKLPG